MYNSSRLQKLMDKINQEAAQAAQKVYDSYTAQVHALIQSEVPKGHKVYTGMGSAGADKNNESYYSEASEKFTQILTNMQYPIQELGETGINLLSEYCG